MIVESGRVERIEEGFAWVICAGQVGCVRCAEGRGCGGGLLGRLLGDRLHRIRAVAGSQALQAGDRVEIGLDEAALLRGSLRVYGFPLLGMLGLPLLLRLFAAQSGDGSLVIASVVGLVAGLAVARHSSEKISRNPLYQPHIIRRVDGWCSAAEE